MQCQSGNECSCDSTQCPGGFEPESCQCKTTTSIFPAPPSLLMCTCECICPDCNDGKVNGNEECDPPFRNDGTCMVGEQSVACGSDCMCPKCEGNRSGPCPEPTDTCTRNSQGNYECVPKPCSQRTSAEGCEGAPGCSGSAECIAVGSMCQCVTSCESRGASSCSNSPNPCPDGESCYPRTDGPDGCRCAPPPCNKCDDGKPVDFKKCSDDGSSVEQCKRHQFYHEQCSYETDLCRYGEFCNGQVECVERCTACGAHSVGSTFCGFGLLSVLECKNDNNDESCDRLPIEECGTDKICVQSGNTATCELKCGNGHMDSGETCDSSADPTGCTDNETCNDDCTDCISNNSTDYSSSAPGDY